MQGHLSHERLNGSRSSAHPHGTGTRPWRPGGLAVRCGRLSPSFVWSPAWPSLLPSCTPVSLIWKARPLQVLPGLWLVPRSSGLCGHVRPAVQGEILRAQPHLCLCT